MSEDRRGPKSKFPHQRINPENKGGWGWSAAVQAQHVNQFLICHYLYGEFQSLTGEEGRADVFQRDTGWSLRTKGIDSLRVCWT